MCSQERAQGSPGAIPAAIPACPGREGGLQQPSSALWESCRWIKAIFSQRWLHQAASPARGSSRVINQSHTAADCISLAGMPISPILALCAKLLYHSSECRPRAEPCTRSRAPVLAGDKDWPLHWLGRAFHACATNEPAATWCCPRSGNVVSTALRVGLALCCAASNGESYKGASRVPGTASLRTEECPASSAELTQTSP